MEPIAIAFKDYRRNPFTGVGSGELTLIHKCTNCGKLSSNRIAGDDSEYNILCLIKDSLAIDNELYSLVRKLKLELITDNNKEESLVSLLGINYKEYLTKLSIKI